MCRLVSDMSDEFDAEYLFKMYSYDESTGYFYCLRATGCRTSGSRLGWVDKSGPLPYLITKVNRKKVRLHRLAFFFMTGRWPEIVDHINGNTLDNRWCNLREVDAKGNCRNTKLMRHNTSGLHGVSRYKGRTWQVYIGARPRIYLGYYDDFFEACCVRKSAEIDNDYHENHGRR